MSFFSHITKVVDNDYLARIRKLPCYRCGRRGPSDPQHMVRRRWREPTRNDYLVIPLCRRCHEWQTTHGVDGDARDIALYVIERLIEFGRIVVPGEKHV